MGNKTIQNERLNSLMRDSGFCSDATADMAKHSKNDRMTSCKKLSRAIVRILKEQGECSPNDLLASGLHKNEVERHWCMAYALAKVELNWMDA